MPGKNNIGFCSKKAIGPENIIFHNATFTSHWRKLTRTHSSSEIPFLWTHWLEREWIMFWKFLRKIYVSCNMNSYTLLNSRRFLPILPTPIARFSSHLQIMKRDRNGWTAVRPRRTVVRKCQIPRLSLPLNQVRLTTYYCYDNIHVRFKVF